MSTPFSRFTSDPLSCPCCGNKQLDTHTQVHGDADGRGPSPGDATICGYCAKPLVFGEGLTLRRFTLADWNALSPESQQALVAAKRAVLELNDAEGSGSR